MRSFVCLILLSFSTILLAQPPGGMARPQTSQVTGHIQGTILDSTTSQAIEFASVVLIDTKGKELDGGLTDSNGKFRFNNIQNGTYSISVSFLSYKTKTIPTFTLTPAKPDYNIRSISLIPLQQILDEIEITGQAALVENKVDKLVYNAEKDVTIGAGDATDVLRKVPLLSVDLEGNVSLRGSNNVKILINGKPSSVFSGSAADALKMFPAEQIKSVEVITNPSSKYDAEGTAGIINILTKKRDIKGFSGNVDLTAGTRQERINVNLNGTKERFGINGNASTFFSIPNIGLTDFYRIDNYEGTKRELRKTGETEQSRLGYWGRIGMFYDFNALNSINSSVQFNGFGFDQDAVFNNVYADPSSASNYSYTQGSKGENGKQGFDWNTDYKKTFNKKDQELSIGFQLVGDVNYNNKTFVQRYTTPGYEDLNYGELTDNDGLGLEKTIQIDYEHPFSKGVKLEIGSKAILRDISSDYIYQIQEGEENKYTTDPSRTDLFEYDQDVIAAYSSLYFNLSKKITANVGTRFETTKIKGSFKNGIVDPFKNSYEQLLPSISLAYSLPKFSSIKLAYSQRIQRPGLQFINPYNDNTDRRSQVYGNPSLNPELTHQVECNYSTFIKGSNVFTSIYYKKTNEIIEQFLRIDSLGNSNSTFENIGENQSIGVTIFTSVNIAKWFALRANVDIGSYDATGTIDGISLSNTGFDYKGFLNATVTLPKDLKFEIWTHYKSPKQTLQGEVASFYMYGAGLKKEFLQKRASIGVSVIDPLSKNKDFITLQEGPGFSQRSEFSIPFQSFGLSLSYKFGKLDFKQRQNQIKNDDLKKEGDDGGGPRF